MGTTVDEKDEVVSMITRESIDVLKSTFRDDVYVRLAPHLFSR